MSTYSYTVANIKFDGDKLKAILLNSEKDKIVHSPPLFNIALKILARVIRELKEIKGIQIGKEEVKLPLFADDLTVYNK